MKRSGTNGTVAVNHSANWNPMHLLPGGCYEIFAYVPDQGSNNEAAQYLLLDGWFGDLWPVVNENQYTNQFADLGGFIARSDGTLPVTLDDLGRTGLFVAADAIAFTYDPSCQGPIGTGLGARYASNQIGPGSPPSLFSTGNVWFTQLGHGYTNHERWTHTNGPTAVSTATWWFPGTPNACYNIKAFIPDNFANNPTALYSIQVGSTVDSLQFNQATATGWKQLAQETTDASGIIIVRLNDTGPVNTYTAADAMQFDRC
jgi:hypothetical protein